MYNNQRCIMIADDEPKMVRALKDLFVANNFFVIEAFDGDEAFDKFLKESTKIDIILLDVMMPGMTGYQVCEEIRNCNCLTPVILLTAKGEEYDQIHGFGAGADDYICKPFSPSILLARVDAVLRRVGKDGSNELHAGRLTVNNASHTAFVDGVALELTRREYDLLYFLVTNSSITFTREQLLDSVWGYDYEGSARTVDTHIKQLRIKTGECAKYFKTVHCVGYEFEVNE